MNSKQRRKAIRLTNQIIIIDNALDALGSYYKLDEVQRKEHYELIKEYLKLDKKLKGKRYFKNSYFAEETITELDVVSAEEILKIFGLENE